MSTFEVLEAYSTLRREVSLISATRLKALAFGLKQMQILYRLTLSAAAMGELAEYTRSDKASITRAVSSMEKSGWVRRLDVKGDRRKIVIELTAKGRGKADKALDLRHYIGQRLNETITPAEQKELSKLLRKVADGLQKQRGHL